MRRVWLHMLWAAQFPLWWIAPNSRAYHAVRVFYAINIGAWLGRNKRPVILNDQQKKRYAVGSLYWMHRYKKSLNQIPLQEMS